MFLLFDFAYLDPGTGSLIIQSLVGAAAGVVLFGRRLLTAGKNKFKRGGAKKPAATPDKTNNAEAEKPEDARN